MAEGSNSQRLDQAARSIDLASTVLKSSNLDLVSLVAQASTKAANEVLEWLAREKISKPAFVYTMTLGQNIARPNLNGLQVLEELEQTSSKLYGMHLVMPGALGRKIIYDEQLRWVGTTEAVILKYHPPSYAVEALCDLFVLTSLEENDARAPAMKARVRPVISKMVDSVHLHTTNMVQGTKPLPAFLEALPKHYLATFTLADAIRSLQSLDKSDLLMKMSCCVIELVDWTLHHWNGKLTMAINNEILFDEQLGDSQYKLTVFIENHCTVDTDCHNDEHVHQFNIGKCVGISFTSYERLYTGITDPGIGCTNESSYRSPLYAIRNPFQSRHCSLNQKEQKAAERHAQEIVRSIVNLPVSPIGGESRARLGFRVDKKSNIMYRFWLKKTPTILQKNLGSNQPPRTIFDQVHASKEIVHDGDDSSGDGDDDVQYTPAQMARWYPEIHSGLTLAYERCECGCNANDLMEVLEQELDEGCLLALIFSEIMLHVAHAMGEAAGVSDVSNFQGPSTSINLSEAATAFLGGIADYGEIFWDTWFRLAASLATGVPYDMGNEETFDVGGGLLFWVTGSMTIAPAWFKLDAEIKLEGSWGIQQLTGSLQGLGAEIAVIEAQCCSTATATNIPAPESTSGGEDVEDAQIETAIFSNTGDLYRIMCMVRTQKALRILNPIDVYHGAILAIRPSCTHERIEQIEVHPWSFNEILLGWNSWKTSDGDHAHVAFLDTPIKQNAAIGFAASRIPIPKATEDLNDRGIGRPQGPEQRHLQQCRVSGFGNVSEGVVIGLNKLDRTRVFVEFLPYTRSAVRNDEDTVLRRVEQLTALLHLPQDSDFRLPVATGFYNDLKRVRYGIVFKISSLTKYPLAKTISLQEILQKITQQSSGMHRRSLGRRLKLAYILALSLSKIQSIGWVHQGIRSENILFRAETETWDGTDGIPFDEPWWSGHGSSRPNTVPSAALYDENPIRNLYRHPARWGAQPVERFNKLHDIYSLGVVLLEIGCCAPVSQIVREEFTKPGASSSSVMEDLLSLSRHARVADLMGEIFARVVELCLKSNASEFGVSQNAETKDDSLLQAAFFQQVVEVLCNAAEAVAGPISKRG